MSSEDTLVEGTTVDLVNNLGSNGEDKESSNIANRSLTMWFGQEADTLTTIVGHRSLTLKARLPEATK